MLKWIRNVGIPVLLVITSIQLVNAKEPAGIMHAAPQTPWQLKYLPAEEIKGLPAAVAENLIRRIDLYSEASGQQPDMTIYHYENLPADLQKEHDKVLQEKYGAKWEETSSEAKNMYNKILERTGESDENILVRRLADKATSLFKMELKQYKYSPENWVKNIVAGTFTAGQIKIDPVSGEPVVKYDNIYEAYGSLALSFAIPGPSNEAGLKDVVINQIEKKLVGKLYDKIAVSKTGGQTQLEDLISKFTMVSLSARNRQVTLKANSFEKESIESAEWYFKKQLKSEQGSGTEVVAVKDLLDKIKKVTNWRELTWRSNVATWRSDVNKWSSSSKAPGWGGVNEPRFEIEYAEEFINYVAKGDLGGAVHAADKIQKATGWNYYLKKYAPDIHQGLNQSIDELKQDYQDYLKK